MGFHTHKTISTLLARHTSSSSVTELARRDLNLLDLYDQITRAAQATSTAGEAVTVAQHTLTRALGGRFTTNHISAINQVVSDANWCTPATPSPGAHQYTHTTGGTITLPEHLAAAGVLATLFTLTQKDPHTTLALLNNH